MKRSAYWRGKSAERGTIVGESLTLTSSRKFARSPYMDAARRLMGKQIDLAIPGEQRGLLTRLFGRRAA